jgi:hypothetical protein
MGKKMPQHDGMQRRVVVGLLSLSLLGLGACVGRQSKPPAPTVTPDQVRSHADQTFEKLKQEERHRTVDPAAGP